MDVMFEKHAWASLLCLVWISGFPAESRGASEPTAGVSTEQRAGFFSTRLISSRIPLLAEEANVDDSAKGDEPAKGFSRAQEVTWIVVITFAVAFVIAWRLGARTEDDIRRLLNRPRTETEDEARSESSTPPDDPAVGESSPQDSGEQDICDTVPEISAVREEDTDPELPTSRE
jgi:hypothetical protein